MEVERQSSIDFVEMSCENAPEPVTATVADDVEPHIVIEFDTRPVVAVKVSHVIAGDN